MDFHLSCPIHCIEIDIEQQVIKHLFNEAQKCKTPSIFCSKCCWLNQHSCGINIHCSHMLFIHDNVLAKKECRAQHNYYTNSRALSVHFCVYIHTTTYTDQREMSLSEHTTKSRQGSQTVSPYFVVNDPHYYYVLQKQFYQV